MPELGDYANSTSSQSAATRVYEALRASIISLELQPGQRLSRNNLAEKFGVSASPLREAIQRLERDGFVATFRQSRTVVTHIDPNLLRQEHFFRTAIECEVVNSLGASADKTQLAKAAAIIKMQTVLVDDPEQIELFRKLDGDFHKELFSAANQLQLYLFAMERSNQMARLRSIDLPSEGKFASVVEGHEAILAAIRSSDCHVATDAMRAHLSGTIARLPDIMDQYPEYFVSNSVRGDGDVEDV